MYEGIIPPTHTLGLSYKVCRVMFFFQKVVSPVQPMKNDGPSLFCLKKNVSEATLLEFQLGVSFEIKVRLSFDSLFYGYHSLCLAS